jgi:hypothetical protein
MILDSPIISGSLTQQAGQTAEIPRYTAVSSSFLAASASFDARIDSIESTTASFSPRINALESFTASVDGTYVNVSGDSMSGNLTITGSLIVTDRITAQEFHTEYVSSSIVFQSGSTKFGDSGDDKHSFTGSVEIDGTVIASNLEGVFSSSAQITGSLGNYYIVSGTITQTTWDNIANKPGGIVSSSQQLTASYDERYVISGSITQTTWDNIANKPSNIVSGAMQVTESLDLRYRLVGDDITFAELTFKPTLISGSSQLDGTTIQNLSGSFSGSFSGSYRGDGSGLTGLAAGAKFHTQTTPSPTWTFIHNLSTQYPNVTVYDSNNNIVLPQSVTATNANTLVLEFGSPVSGYATAGIGGIIEVNGRTIKQYFTSSLNWRFEHNIGDRFINIQTFDGGYEKIIPQTIALTDTTSSLITFPEATEGWAVGTIGGDLPSISSSYGGYVLQVSAGAPYTASWTAVANVTASNAVNALTASHLNPISQSLIPAVSGTYDLGSQSNPWKHIYVGTGSIYLVDNSGTIVKTLTGDSIVTNDNLSSLNAFTASNFTTNTFTSSASARLNSIETITSSNVARLNAVETITASNIARLNSLEIKTGSLATTGSNTFIGTQTITGSLYISSDLIVQGSSSLQNITASAVSIGTNLINLNTANPAIRYAGLSIGDSGSIGGSGSFLYDSVQDEMIFVHRGTSTVVTSSVTLMGPQTFDNVGNETYPTSNYIQKGTGNEHLVDSSIIDTGTQVSMFSNALFISSSNRVGINTPTPSTALTVIGNIKAGYESATGMIIGLAPSGIPANDVNSYILWGDAASFGGNNGDLIYIPRTSTTADHRFYTGNGTPTEKLRITHSGLVGVNITTPCSRLHVAVSTNTDGIFLGRISSCTNKQAIFIAADDAVGAYIAGGTHPNGTSTQSDGFGRMVIQNGQSEGFQFQTSCSLVGCAQSWSTRMVIKQVGNIGIGTTSPNASSPLHVKMCANSNGDGIRIQAVCSGGPGSQPGIAFANISDSKRYNISLDNAGDILQITNNVGSNTFQMNQSSVACFGGTVCVPAGLVFAGGGCSLNYYYQSGNWTPQFYAGGGTSFGLASQSGTGRYTRIGNVVNVHGQISWSGAGTSGSLLAIRLPFNSNAAARGGMSPGIVSGISGMINGLTMISEIGSCWLYLMTPQNGGSHVHLGGTNVTNGGSMLFSFAGTFITDDI